ncbi:MAG: molybdopterin-dependent oxidoreductase, partial [Betaproteobacteria bacterium]
MHLIPDRGFQHPVPSEITPRDLALNRRQWLAAAGAAAVALPAAAQTPRPGKLTPLPGAPSAVPGASTVEKITAYVHASTYNNFYEFGTDKSDPARYAHTLKTRPWTVQVEGEVARPGRFDIDALMKLAPMEERVYRLRCVEAWSAVVPWVGYPLAELIKAVEQSGDPAVDVLGAVVG